MLSCNRFCCSLGSLTSKLVLGLGLALGVSTTAYADLNETSKLSEKQFDTCENHLTGDALQAGLKKWGGTTVVLDTNVILNDPYAIYKYPGSTVVIPGTVLEEIDDKKHDEKTGFAARIFSREIDSMLRAGANLRAGVDLGSEATLKVDTRDMTHLFNDKTFDKKKKDNAIVATALAYKKDGGEESKTYLISDDINVRIKASSEELTALPVEYEWVTPAREIEQEYQTAVISREQLQSFTEKGELAAPAELKIRPNEFVMLKTEDFEGGPDLMARYVFDRENPEKSSLRKLQSFDHLTLKPKNIEQQMGLELLLDPSVELVIFESEAGTGKSFITLLAGLLQIPAGGKNPIYEDMMITRHMAEVGRISLGTLPGDKNQKLSESYNSFYDNLRVIKTALIDKKSDKPDQPNKTQRRREINADLTGNVLAVPPTEAAKKLIVPKDKNKPVNIPGVELLAFSYIRGRSLHNTFVIVDEFQNTSIHEAKTLLTRIGEGSKVVVLGDTGQIDVPYLNERNNGLAVTTTIFTSDDLSDVDRSRVGFIRMKETVRSDLSDLSVRVFKKFVPSQRR